MPIDSDTDVAKSNLGGLFFRRAPLWFKGTKRVLGTSSPWPSVAGPEAGSWHYRGPGEGDGRMEPWVLQMLLGQR